MRLLITVEQELEHERRQLLSQQEKLRQVHSHNLSTFDSYTPLPLHTHWTNFFKSCMKTCFHSLWEDCGGWGVNPKITGHFKYFNHPIPSKNPSSSSLTNNALCRREQSALEEERRRLEEEKKIFRSTISKASGSELSASTQSQTSHQVWMGFTSLTWRPKSDRFSLSHLYCCLAPKLQKCIIFAKNIFALSAFRATEMSYADTNV